MKTDRRTFLRDSAVATGGLSLAFHLPACSGGKPADRWGGPKDLVPNANLRITDDNRVIFTLGRVEMGQGTLTSQVMIAAEQLDLDPSLVEVELAPNHQDFADPAFNVQVTGGSASTKGAFEPLSKVGAMARDALLSAAAAALAVNPAELSFEGKAVVHAPSGRKKSFGEIANAARDFLDDGATPKAKKDWKIMGKSHTRLDAQSKVDGSAKYGADYAPPGVETAVIIRGPLGSTPVKVDAEAAKKVRGVKEVLTTPHGVAVVADKYHQARKAAGQVKVEWTPSDFSTDAMYERFAKALDTRDMEGNARSDGDAPEYLLGREGVLEAEYRLPYLAHATMEPQNATVKWSED
ncbi:MAG: molybdopterin cofactor-binding domain-containing protein, partial [Myxococcota bacterium]